ncbi:thioredoxin TrxC [Maritimibacter sp. UBA3975]|uniref:thioredoxin TrxC n=1 Tax=Maritimibacter sp. UBA3975 TaxID=1946833 RepID=UPI000C09D077|nr:thioredoxin TrxC [Maritimibacter sp. UBA3975]MAM60411.1 thiol reductase thioredoxin [Maritimibacter sp.]|tara:strand:+ start:1455 stop:1901 length:447 start_codon:yes stop_codon:yes gene_type:complete
MAKHVKLTCLDCGALNRAPEDKLGAGPKCGTCGAKLIDGKVRELDPATLAKAAKADDLPLLVDFWAPWCGPCRMMAPEFQKAAQALAPHARLAKINTEDFPKVSMKNNIRGIPALILYQKGREVARQAGAIRAAQIEDFVRSKAKVGA